MDMGNSYAREKVGAAVNSLATGVGGIKERLVEAFYCMGPLSDKDFKQPELEQWQSIFGRATAVEGGEEGSIRASLTQMSDDEAVLLASDIADLDTSLRQ